MISGPTATSDNTNEHYPISIFYIIHVSFVLSTCTMSIYWYGLKDWPKKQGWMQKYASASGTSKFIKQIQVADNYVEAITKAG